MIKYKVKTSLAPIAILAIIVIISIILSLSLKSENDPYVDSSAVPEQVNTVKTVIIDAGHGGEDCGAIGKTGVYEKDLNMQISLKLGEYLSAAGYSVVYTREDDRLLYTEEQNIKGMRKIYDLKNRVEIANSYNSALLVSIHMNSYGAESCSGLQVYYAEGNDSSVSLANKVQESVVNTLQPNNKRKIKEGNGIYLLENSINPCILIECGFISNYDECKKLSEKEYQKELCFSILCGIIEYINEK